MGTKVTNSKNEKSNGYLKPPPYEFDIDKPRNRIERRAKKSILRKGSAK